MRMRENIISPQSFNARFFWRQNSTVAYDYQKEFFNYPSSYRMWDFVTPDFYKIMKSGGIVNNPMYRVSMKKTVIPFAFTATGRNGSTTYSMVKSFEHAVDAPNYSLFSSIDEVDAYLDSFTYNNYRNFAITAAWANVDESEIQALASLGEMPETVEWIVSILVRAKKLFLAWKDKKALLYLKRSLSRHPGDTISNFWLEFRYAVRPLVFEMVQAMNALRAKINRAIRHTARGFSRLDDVSSESSTSVDYHQAQCSVRSITASSANFRAGVLYQVMDNLNDIMAVWGLNQPLQTIWELTPFSFIVDWFLGIGNLISSWSISTQLSPQASWITEEHVFSSYAFGASYWRHPNFLKQTNVTFVVSDPGSTRYEYVIKRRLPSPKRPLFPAFRINLDVGKITDLAAICRGIFHSIR